MIATHSFPPEFLGLDILSNRSLSVGLSRLTIAGAAAVARASRIRYTRWHFETSVQCLRVQTQNRPLSTYS